MESVVEATLDDHDEARGEKGAFQTIRQAGHDEEGASQALHRSDLVGNTHGCWLVHRDEQNNPG